MSFPRNALRIHQESKINKPFAVKGRATGILNKAHMPLWIYFLIAGFGMLGLVYVYHFGVNVPWLDQWETVVLIEKYFSGKLSFADLFGQHNEHRIFVPNVVMLVLGLWTKLNCFAEMYLIQCGFLMASFLMTWIFWRECEKPDDVGFVAFIPVLIFSFKQFGNILWSFQLTFVFAQTFAILAFYFLHRLSDNTKHVRFMAGAVASACAASFSSAQGLLVWPAGLLQLTLERIPSAKKKRLTALWLSLAVVVWVLYFRGYSKPQQHPSVFDFVSNPAAAVKFFVVLLGESLCWEMESAVFVGLLVLIVFAVSIFVLCRARKHDRLAFWIAVTIFALFALGTITLGRSGFGLEFAQASRYVTYSILAVVGTYSLITRAGAIGGSFSRAALVVFRVILCVALPLGYYLGWQAGRETQKSRRIAANILLHYRNATDEELAGLYPVSGAELRRRAAVLEKLGYSVFAQRR